MSHPLSSNAEFNKKMEFFETPEWVARRIFEVELMTKTILDPAAGRGVLGNAARQSGYTDVLEFDLVKWDRASPTITPDVNFLKATSDDLKVTDKDFTVVMNPPFSYAVAFVKKSFELGARKVVMFQRLSFNESLIRRQFWEDNPCARQHVCGERATCWRGDILTEDTFGRSAPTAHSWYVWERGHRGAETLQRLYKSSTSKV